MYRQSQNAFFSQQHKALSFWAKKLSILQTFDVKSETRDAFENLWFGGGCCCFFGLGGGGG